MESKDDDGIRKVREEKKRRYQDQAYVKTRGKVETMGGELGDRTAGRKAEGRERSRVEGWEGRKELVGVSGRLTGGTEAMRTTEGGGGLQRGRPGEGRRQGGRAGGDGRGGVLSRR